MKVFVVLDMSVGKFRGVFSRLDSAQAFAVKENIYITDICEAQMDVPFIAFEQK